MKKLLLLLITTKTLFSEPFRIIGPRPLALGNSYTAISEDSIANFYNPATADTPDKFELQFPIIGLGLNFTGDILDSVNKISKLANDYQKIQTAQNTGNFLTLQTLSTFVEALKELNELNEPSKGLLLNLGAGIAIKLDKFTVSFINYSSIGVDPNIDLSGVWLGSSTAGSPKLSLKSNSYEGVDFSQIPGIQVSTSTPQDPALAEASQKLSTFIQTLSKEAGANLGNYTSQQISNALINYASEQGMSTEEIISTVNTIKELEPLITDILKNKDPTKIYSQNNSNIKLIGLSLFELSLGYSQNLPPIGNLEFLKNLTAGINLKIMYAQTGYTKQYILKGEGSTGSDILTDYKQYLKDSYALGIDLGFLFDKKEDWRTKFGLTIKNINSPTFLVPDEAKKYNEDDITLYPQVRFGVAFWPLPFWILTSDLDLTRNQTFIEGYYSQNFSFGSEINIINRKTFNLPLRIGFLQNIQTGDLTYTFGTGIRTYFFTFDLSAALSQKNAYIEGVTIPSNVFLQISSGLKF